ncbi:MAG: peptidase S10, partial [Myxococcota bacterium]
RIDFPDDGSLPPSPVRLIDNETSWLHFTDLVFVDPIGTGFSRIITKKGEKKDDKVTSGANPEDKKKFWNVGKDLDALGELIRRYLTRHRRWSSPIFIAGESYGGFRVAKLIQQLQEKDGVGLSGAILISPALEFELLSGTDYSVLSWVDRLPTMAAAGYLHGRATPAADSLAGHMAAAETFAREELSVILISGAAATAEQRDRVFAKMAELTGLDRALIQRCAGRVDIRRFSRELLHDEGKVIGLYDASVTAIDPFPDRTEFQGPDPTLAGLSRLFTAGIYQQLRESLEVDEEIRDYHLLSYEVFQNWKYDSDGTQQQGRVSSTDEMRYGMSLNPDVKVLISHGYYDLVTPYYSSDRLADQMRLDPQLRAQLTLRHFQGGHMFYTWKESRDAFYQTALTFYADALSVVEKTSS